MHFQLEIIGLDIQGMLKIKCKKHTNIVINFQNCTFNSMENLNFSECSHTQLNVNNTNFYGL